jgi:hypothetical protein
MKLEIFESNCTLQLVAICLPWRWQLRRLKCWTFICQVDVSEQNREDRINPVDALDGGLGMSTGHQVLNTTPLKIPASLLHLVAPRGFEHGDMRNVPSTD